MSLQVICEVHLVPLQKNVTKAVPEYKYFM